MTDVAQAGLTASKTIGIHNAYFKNTPAFELHLHSLIFSCAYYACPASHRPFFSFAALSLKLDCINFSSWLRAWSIDIWADCKKIRRLKSLALRFGN